jgi:hypothetical protein
MGVAANLKRELPHPIEMWDPVTPNKPGLKALAYFQLIPRAKARGFT